MSAKQRSRGERHPICQERPAQSLSAGWAPVPLLLNSPFLPQQPPPPTPPQAVQDSPSVHLCLYIPWGGVCQSGTEILNDMDPRFRGAQMPTRCPPALTWPTAPPSAYQRVRAASVVAEQTLQTLVAALFCPVSFSRSDAWCGGGVQLGFFFSNLSGLFLLSISASAEPGLQRRGASFLSAPLFLPARASYSGGSWGSRNREQSSAAIPILQPPAFKSLFQRDGDSGACVNFSELCHSHKVWQ